MNDISSGKLRGIMKLADANGRFKMMAIDQRGSMVQALADALNTDKTDVRYEDVAAIKTLITRILTPNATAVLTDPIYGHPYSITEVPRDVALLLAYEESGYVSEGVAENERLSNPIENWTIGKAQRAGADAIKLLAYYHPDASAETLEHQQAFVRHVGDACEKHDLPFLLELVSYALEGTTKSAAFAKQKPDLVIRSVAEFIDPSYKVDILKLEFPADLKYTAAYQNASFYAGESAYELAEVKEACQKLDETSTLPWVILSAGVDIEEFIENVNLATDAGASGSSADALSGKKPSTTILIRTRLKNSSKMRQPPTSRTPTQQPKTRYRGLNTVNSGGLETLKSLNSPQRGIKTIKSM